MKKDVIALKLLLISIAIFTSFVLSGMEKTETKEDIMFKGYINKSDKEMTWSIADSYSKSIYITLNPNGIKFYDHVLKYDPIAARYQKFCIERQGVWRAFSPLGKYKEFIIIQKSDSPNDWEEVDYNDFLSNQ